MPRKPRMYLPGLPAHIVQRGNNHEPCFFSEDDYRFYLDRLAQALKRYSVQIHAYVLMTNHVHLLLTPEDADGISKVMSLLGQYYVRHINRTYQRTGTLWEGRHKASIIDSDEYLLCCYRYIELNPVRAGMVKFPDGYPWSSYLYHAWGEDNPLLRDHSLFFELGQTSAARQSAYRNLFKDDLDDVMIQTIRRAIHYNYPLGNDRFREKIEKTLKRQVGQSKRGRPKNNK